jgi:membrane fusion protein, copper/silver efflux system
MNRAGRTGLTLAAVLAAGAGGYWAGQHPTVLPPLPWLHAAPGLERTASVPGHSNPAALGPVIYYRDPDGRPIYSADPHSTADGRAFVAVHASEDISFEEHSEAQTSALVQAGAEPKKVLYYRNPMGLPDTSPVPKKDSMGMDYIPIYAGEDEAGTTVRLAPGKLQRTGVRTEAVSNRVIVRPVRAPGTVQPDERNVVVVSVPARGIG